MSHQKIWDKALGEGERIEHEFSLSSRYLNFNLFFWMLVGLVILVFGFSNIIFFVVGVLMFAVAFFHFGFLLRWSNRFAFTNKRVLIHRGWLNTSMMSIDYSQITEIEARQDFTEKLLYKSGSIFLNTAGSSHQEAVITNVGDPYMLKQKLAELMEKDERAMYTGQINKT